MHCAVLRARSSGAALALVLGACGPPPVVPDTPGDCDDPDPRTQVGATEVCGDGVINDCETTEEDLPRQCLSREAGSADATFTGASDLALGWTVSDLGDYDGDGVADVLVGTREVPEGASTSLVYVFSTGHSGAVSVDAAIATIGGTDAERGSELTIAGAGDVDHDGLADLIVGVGDRARVYLVLGGQEGAISLGDAHLQVQDPDGGSQAGGAVAGGGDFNGDGTPDLLIGADTQGYYGAGEGRGAVYVVSGTLSGSVTTADALLTVTGAEKDQSRLGRSVDFAGDFDGDGLDDIVVGDPWAYDQYGRAYVIPGGEEGTWDWMDGGVMEGPSMWGGAGEVVRGGGDCDGDGLDDVLVHTPTYWKVNYDVTGFVQVYLGTALVGLEVWEPHMTIYGGEYRAQIGLSMDFAGDVDHDGRDDLLVGSASPVSVSIVYCGPTGSSELEDLDRAFIEGLGPHGANQVAGLGDVDSDGWPDLLVGAPLDGVAHLVRVRPAW